MELRREKILLYPLIVLVIFAFVCFCVSVDTRPSLCRYIRLYV